MLFSWLDNAGFFSIQWAPTESSAAGVTYVLPSIKGLLRVFVPVAGEEVEVYTGTLTQAHLRYRGLIRSEAELLQFVPSR